jgi:hypothetical protein
MKHYSPAGRRNHGRTLKRLLDTWDRNGSTRGPTPWKKDDDDELWSYVILLNPLPLIRSTCGEYPLFLWWVYGNANTYPQSTRSITTELIC